MRDSLFETFSSARIKSALRRQADQLLPNREIRQYQAWIAERFRYRQGLYQTNPVPGLLSILTPVWDGSPLVYLKRLAESIKAQNQAGASEWIVLDNGCSDARLLSFLAQLRERNWVKLHRVSSNVGIIQGLRQCLELAAGHYVLPVDGDDLLYRDALQIVTYWIQRAGYPPLLYTDEDKVIGTRLYQPYLKPDWDPVLLLNSAYIAHLGVIDREKALDLGAYSDRESEGSADWDLFVRFLIAGYTAVHIPEIVYSWRVHASSTADDSATKPYIHSSQRSVLQRFLSARPDSGAFSVESNPLLPGGAHFRICRNRNGSARFISVLLNRNFDVRELASVAQEMATKGGFVHLVGDDVEVEDRDWPWEALALFELHRDAAMAGGRVRNRRGQITEAGRYFGFGDVCGCPNRGRSSEDPGYFAQMWKRRSVSAVSAQFAVIQPAFLLDLLPKLPSQASISFLGAWAGAYALRTGKRIIYSPFLSGISDLDWETLTEESERELFSELNVDLIPDRRFYSPHLSLKAAFGLGDPKG